MMLEDVVQSLLVCVSNPEARPGLIKSFFNPYSPLWVVLGHFGVHPKPSHNGEDLANLAAKFLTNQAVSVDDAEVMTASTFDPQTKTIEVPFEILSVCPELQTTVFDDVCPLEELQRSLILLIIEEIAHSSQAIDLESGFFRPLSRSYRYLASEHQHLGGSYPLSMESIHARLQAAKGGSEVELARTKDPLFCVEGDVSALILETVVAPGELLDAYNVRSALEKLRLHETLWWRGRQQRYGENLFIEVIPMQESFREEYLRQKGVDLAVL